MKFKREKRSHLAGHTEIVFTEVAEGGEKPFPPWRITSDRSGMRFEGNSVTISSTEELQEFAKVVSDAWLAHVDQVPKIISSVSGH